MDLLGLCESLATSADVKSLLHGLSLNYLFQTLNSGEVSLPGHLTAVKTLDLGFNAALTLYQFSIAVEAITTNLVA